MSIPSLSPECVHFHWDKMAALLHRSLDVKDTTTEFETVRREWQDRLGYDMYGPDCGPCGQQCKHLVGNIVRHRFAKGMPTILAADLEHQPAELQQNAVQNAVQTHMARFNELWQLTENEELTACACRATEMVTRTRAYPKEQQPAVADAVAVCHWRMDSLLLSTLTPYFVETVKESEKIRSKSVELAADRASTQRRAECIPMTFPFLGKVVSELDTSEYSNGQ